MAAVQLCKKQIKSFIDSFDTILVDCDGVLWTGSKIIERSAETLNYLKEAGKKIFYVTNNSTKTRNQYLTKLTKLGFKAEENEIATSGYLVASYLQSIGFSKTVYLIGSAGLAEELSTHGIKHTPPGPDPMLTEIHTYINGTIHSEGDIGAVVVGFDEYISYPKILKAANYLSNQDCLFLATNADETFPVEKQLIVPGTGTMVAAVQTGSQREPKVFGKPFRPMFDAISKQYKIIPERTVMVGDRCNTDIAFGKNCGLQTLLVLTGVTNLSQLQNFQENPNNNHLIPDYYVNKLGDLLELLENDSCE